MRNLTKINFFIFKNKIKFLKKYLFISLALFPTTLFFTVSQIFNYNYKGSNDSNIYIFYNILIFILTLSYFLFNFIFNKVTLKKGNILFLFLPLTIIFFYFLNIFRGVNNNFSDQYFIYFLLWSIPAIIAGIFLSVSAKNYYILDVIDVVTFLINIAIINVLINLFFLNGTISFGGETYQTLSYLAAFSYGINLYNLLLSESKKISRFKFINYSLLFMQVITVFMSGGRGGVVLLLAYSLITVILVFYKNKAKSVIKFFIITTILILGYYISIDLITFNPILINSFNRIFGFFTAEGLSLEAASRDDLYNISLNLIINKPFVGYGLFIWGMDSYSHNLILDIILNGGFLLLLLFFLFAIFFFFKIFKLIKFDKRYLKIFYIFLFPLVFLMFSSTFWINSLFWFCFTFVINSEYKPLIE
jgi:O-antigen ligase